MLRASSFFHRVLFVDADSTARAAFLRRAPAWGYEAEAVESWAQAVPRLSEASWDWIYTDLFWGNSGKRLLLESCTKDPGKSDVLRVLALPAAGQEEPSASLCLGSWEKPLSLESWEKWRTQHGSDSLDEGVAPSEPGRRKTLRVLVVESDPVDAIFLQFALQRPEFQFQVKRVATWELARQLIRGGAFDVLLVHFDPSFEVFFDEVQETCLEHKELALLVISEEADEIHAEKALERGAQDWLLLTEFSKNAVGRSIRHAAERKLTELRMLQLATRDQLTGLMNRASYRQCVQLAVTRAKKAQSHFAIFSLDFEGLKRINDELGQDAGDSLIRQAAHRLREVLGKVETVARLGGDEFAVLLEDIANHEEALRLAEQCRMKLAQPFVLNEEATTLRVRVGLAFFPEAGQTTDALLSAADAALLQSKQRGFRDVFVFSAQYHEESLQRYRMEQRLRMALIEQEFHLVFQPQVFARDPTSLGGAEALLRWTPRGMAPVSPGVFIPLLESSGQIVEVGAWVLRQACEWRKRILMRGYPCPRISVNVSGRQLERPEYYEEVRTLVEEYQLPPGALELEITEATLVKQAAVAIELIRQLKELGVRFSLDDFGTGYSSLNYLSRFPVDTLKVDQSFVRRLPEDEKTMVLASAIFELGRGLGLEIVAEGVETIAQQNVVRDLGAHLIQGYLTGRPCAPEDLLQRIAESSAVQQRQGVEAGAPR